MFEKKGEGFFVLSPKKLEEQEQKAGQKAGQILPKENKTIEKRLKDIEDRLKAGGL